MDGNRYRHKDEKRDEIGIIITIRMGMSIGTGIVRGIETGIGMRAGIQSLLGMKVKNS